MSDSVILIDKDAHGTPFYDLDFSAKKYDAILTAGAEQSLAIPTIKGFAAKYIFVTTSSAPIYIGFESFTLNAGSTFAQNLYIQIPTGGGMIVKVPSEITGGGAPTTVYAQTANDNNRVQLVFFLA